jgi:hypothetical protein
MFDDKDKAQIFFKGLDNDFDDKSDAYFFGNPLIPQLYHYQDCMTQHVEGILDDDLWQAEKNMLGSIIGDPGFIAFWPTMRAFFTPAFVDLVGNLEHSGSHINYEFETREWKHTTRVPRADN